MKKNALYLIILLSLTSLIFAGNVNLVGTWQLGNLTIIFNSDGTYIWKDNVATLKGNYKVEGTFLTMYYQGKPSQYLILINDGNLRLTDAKGNVINLKKVSSSGSNVPSSSSSSTSIDQLYGTWQAGSIKLILDRSGKYMFGTSTGTFQVSGSKIIMYDSRTGNQTAYDFLLQGNVLKLRDPQGNILPLQRVSSSGSSGSSGSYGSYGSSGSSSTSSPLVGKWVLKNNPRVYVIFDSNGNYDFAGDKGTYKSSASQIYFTSFKTNRTSTYDYKISGNLLYLRDPQGNVIAFTKQ